MTPDLTAAVRQALAHVRDPELDEPITDPGFVATCTVDPDGQATVRLRLPTYFCLLRSRLRLPDGGRRPRCRSGSPRGGGGRRRPRRPLRLGRDQWGVAAGRTFVESFQGLAQAELDELRAQFPGKAVLAGTDRVCQPLLTAGRTHDELARLTVGHVPATPELERLLSHRAELKLPAGPDAPLVIDPHPARASPPARWRST